MRMKLIVAMVSGDKADAVVDAARAGGTTGAAVISSGRGEGLRPRKTFLGLDLAAKSDLALFLVVETRARENTGTHPRRGAFGRAKRWRGVSTRH